MDSQSFSSVTPGMPGRSAVMEAASLDIPCVISSFLDFILLVVLPYFMLIKIRPGLGSRRNVSSHRNSLIKLSRGTAVALWVAAVVVWLTWTIRYGFEPRAQTFLFLLLVFFDAFIFLVSIFPVWYEDFSQYMDEDVVLNDFETSMSGDEEEGNFKGDNVCTQSWIYKYTERLIQLFLSLAFAK